MFSGVETLKISVATYITMNKTLTVKNIKMFYNVNIEKQCVLYYIPMILNAVCILSMIQIKCLHYD